SLIIDVYAALTRTVDTTVEVEEEPQKPAVSVRRSITPDYLVCLEDGKQFKSLKRHLRTHYDLSPEEYREKWGLPADYPMVAPNYAAARSALAKKMGLGQQRIK
ncbi:MAG: MucR family transcriptional regulator, partial [Rhizobiales bacterium]|nr:MucR family transcriptional regulator [Hyphomicrobiales bacterium]